MLGRLSSSPIRVLRNTDLKRLATARALRAAPRATLLTRHLAYIAPAKMSFPATIQAIGMQKTGDIDVVEQLEVPFPTPKPNEILVKVRGPLAVPIATILTVTNNCRLNMAV